MTFAAGLLVAALVPGVQIDGTWLNAEEAKAKGLVLSEADGRITLENRSDASVRPEELGWRKEGTDDFDVGGLKVYLESWQMASPCGVRNWDDEPFDYSSGYLHNCVSTPSDFHPGERGTFLSDHQCCFRRPDGRMRLYGFTTGRDRFGHFRMKLDAKGAREFHALCACDRAELKPGGKIVTEKLVTMDGDDTEELFGRFADRWAADSNARHRFGAPVGWCSWYYYFENVSLAGVIENMDWFNAHREEGFDRVKYIQLDDGYEVALGDWFIPNERFPGGLKRFADEVKARGFTPAVWVGPFMVEENARLLKEHPDWMVKGADGKPASPLTWRHDHKIYVLDGTHPAVQDHLRNVFRTLRGYGIDYVKLDFCMIASSIPGARYHDPTATRAQALRRAFEAIREGFGEDGFILGCTAPFGSLVGIVDAMRSSTDITPYWRGEGHQYAEAPTVPNVCRNIINHSYLNGRLWINDPDTLIVRDDSTKLTEDEVRLWAKAVTMTGGSLMLSDRFSTLSEKRLPLVKEVLSRMNRTPSAHPVDRWERTFPSVWGTPDGVRQPFNFSDWKSSIDGRILEPHSIRPATASVKRVGAVNWDCSVPSTTFFGKATTHTLGPEKWRDRTPYYAEVVGKDAIEHHERTLAEYEVEMKYAIDAGIDYFAYCWYDLTPPEGDRSTCAGHLQEITRARRLHVQSPLRDGLSLCAILVTSHPYSDACLEALAAEMKNPWYEKVDGRPLVYMFASTKTVAPRLREICRAVHAGDPYVVAMITEPPSACTNDFVGADALCAYACTEAEPDPADYSDMAVHWNAIRATAGLPVVPLFSTGWDPRPRMERPAPWSNYPDKPWATKLSAANWLDQAGKLRRWIEANPKSCPTGHVMAFAWNEFEEGGWICPNIGADGRPDAARVKDFRKVVDSLKASPSAEEGALSKHGYFTDDALLDADMDGLMDEIALVLARSDRAFETAAKAAAKCTGDERTAIEKRTEIARRLKLYVARRALAKERDERILAWQGAKDLELLYDYFNRELSRAEARENRPAAVVLDVTDFGAKGDGVTDDGPAFRAALEAAAKAGGRPVVVKIPAGRFALGGDPRSPFKDFKLNDWQTGENRGPTAYWTWSSTSLHLMMLNLENVTVRGEGGRTTVVFTDSTKGGFGMYGCAGCSIENLTVDYPDNPSTQGVVEKVETEPFALVFRRQPGYPDPDSPRFLEAPSRYFSPVGEDGHYLPTGVGRLGSVERIGTDLFRLVPQARHVNDGTWRGVRPGGRLCIVARYAENQANPVKAQWSSFCAVRNVRFLDSPGQAIWFSGCYAFSITGCRATGRDGSDDVVKGNADAILGSGMIGPYVSGCVFSGLEDDGINIGSNTGEVSSVPADRLFRQCRTNGSMPAAGGFVSDGETGRIKMFMRYGKDDVATRPMPADVVSGEDVKKSGTRDKSFLGGVYTRKGMLRSDKLIRVPNTTGAVLRDTEFSWLRGRGIQVHCGNMLIENVKVHDVTGVGISIHALIAWSMCYDIYNVLVRNCSFERVGGGHAVSTHPDELGYVEPMTFRMHFAIELDKCTIDPGDGKTGVYVANTDDVLVRDCKFGPGCSNPPVRAKHATNLEIK